MRLEIHHHHHLSDNDRELLVAILSKLTDLSEDIVMISTEVQNLIAQSQSANTVLGSMDLRFKAMVAQIADLQTTVTNLRSGSVMTDAEKASIVTLTGQLAANISNAQADILANTPDAPAADDPNAPAGGTPNASGGNPQSNDPSAAASASAPAGTTTAQPDPSPTGNQSGAGSANQGAPNSGNPDPIAPPSTPPAGSQS